MSDISIPAVSLGLRRVRFMPAGVAILAVLFLGIAFWNGFPLMFYDTGGYMAEGLSGAFLVERSPVYSLLLRFTGGAFSLWAVVILQALMSAYLIALTARIEAPRLTLAGLIGIGTALMAATGIGWYVGQVEPDCMTALVFLGSYLLLFRKEALERWSLALVVAITGLSVASHPSHLGLMAGFVLAGGALKALRLWWPKLPRARLGFAGMAFALAIALILAGNLALARSLFISRAGPVFVFARLMQDGIIQRLLHDTCPQSGYDLCPYQNRLPRNANAWLWGEHSLFFREGGFGQSQVQDDRMILDSLRRYPWMNLKAAFRDSVLQFFMFRTGDGIESQARILRPEFSRDAPGQLAAYLGARQQSEKIRFQTLNMIHVTVGALSLLGLVLLLVQAIRQERWSDTGFAGLVLLGLIGNAIICGTVSNPHDRYQSRVIWLPAFVLLLARVKNPNSLHPEPESGT